MSSQYFQQLDAAYKTAYLDKIKVIGVDPYTITEFSDKREDLPNIVYGDIVNYLVFNRSVYTLQEFKNFKSLDSYNQFVCGWVKTLSVKKINNYCVVIASVLHSQRLREKPLNCWIIAKPDGEVMCAHCTCVAGLGETCTHVGAVLFAIEHNISKLEPVSVTGVKAYWKVPHSKPGEPSTSHQIDFSSQQKLAKIAKGEVEPYVRRGEEECTIPKATVKEIAANIQHLYDEGKQSALFATLPPFCHSWQTEETCEKGRLDLIYKKEFELKDLVSLVEFGAKIDLKITAEESQRIEEITRKQSKSSDWFKYRTGRITASNFKSCVRTGIDNPSLSLLKKICYPTRAVFKSPYTKYGCTHEKHALKDFLVVVRKNHFDVKVTECGLVINPEYPQCGATPDAFIECSCCGLGCVEVKCPWCAQHMDIENATYLKNFCLKKDSHGLHLQKDHAYYYQVQMQLAVTERKHGFFVVWSKKSLFVEKIHTDNEFWKSEFAKAKLFFDNVVLPELLGKFYTRKKRQLEDTEPEVAPEIDVYCVCRQPCNDRPMIACDNADRCSYEWYHLDCIKMDISQIPQRWTCNFCNSSQENV